MIRNESGFIYPLTYCILILASTFLVVQLEQYLAEKRLLLETTRILKQDYYLMKSVKEVEVILSTDSEYASESDFTFSSGVVHYQISSLSDSMLKIDFTLTDKENIKIVGYSLYDKNLKKMIKWIEKT